MKMMQFVDSHCHLDFPDFAEDFSGMLARAKAVGVTQCLTISTKLRTFPKVLALAEQYPNLYCSVGVHPHEAENERGAGLQDLLRHTEHPKVVGIGETGLDYYYDHSDRTLQKDGFSLHIEAARQSGLPLIVHCRDAEGDTVELLKDGAEGGELKGVIHCFTGTDYLADEALALGFYISISGIVTFKNAKDLQRIAARIPSDRLLIETDAPYLAPVPMRGKRNEPAFVRHTAECLAVLRGESLADIARTTSENYFRLFSKAAKPAQ